MVWITLYIALMFWKLDHVISEQLCSCTNEITLPIYTRPMKMSALLTKLLFQDCIEVLQDGIPENYQWSKVLYQKKVGYMLTSDSNRYLCQEEEHSQIVRRFIGDFYKCLADHCMRCHCEKHEASCGDCRATCSFDYSDLCTKWDNRVDGQWSTWMSWSNCSTTVCDNVGVRTRTRECNNPPKSAQFGKDCIGEKTQTENCTKSCKVDGGFSDWTPWTECVGDCGATTLSYRHRTCDNPKPQGGGNQCKGTKFSYRPCVVTCTTSTTTTTTPTTELKTTTTTPTATPTKRTTPTITTTSLTTPSTTPPITTTTTPTTTPTTTITTTDTTTTPILVTTDISTKQSPSTELSTEQTTEPSTDATTPTTTGTAITTDITTKQSPSTELSTDTSTDATKPPTTAATEGTTPSQHTTTEVSSLPTTDTNIITTVTIPVPEMPHCDKIKITDEIVKGIVISSPNAVSCPESGLHNSPEAAVIENCNVSAPDTWTKGMSVTDLCNIGVPDNYFPPISSFIGGNYDRVHDLSGVLLKCTNTGVQIALQVCGHAVAIYPLNNKSFAPTLNLNNYYVIN